MKELDSRVCLKSDFKLEFDIGCIKDHDLIIAHYKAEQEIIKNLTDDEFNYFYHIVANVLPREKELMAMAISHCEKHDMIVNLNRINEIDDSHYER